LNLNFLKEKINFELELFGWHIGLTNLKWLILDSV